ncbi:PMS1 protein homolog 1 [Protopterus annectens]|uniref:PMS1 protein homolog 1 n=1 Tax=Protopterus annectens TaxID=7888 RepID=UPI001CFB4ED4|nr:PMS1 protein homolog 1 [Protopterus annectens]
MNQLPTDTICLLSSSQVITSVVSVVKELIENSLDASATNIEVRLDNYGLDRIEVRDNGDGIKSADTSFMALKHYTSKISSHDDLESLATYGFRGEALASICAISEVTVTTKTADDDVSFQYILDNTGHVVSQKPSHLGQGTTVTVLKLFKNLPVRKQFYSTAKKCKEELKKVQDLLMAYSVIKPELRIVFTHNKTIIWQKSKVSDHRMALRSVLGAAIMSCMVPFQHHCKDPEVFISGFLPKPGSDTSLTSLSSSDRSLIFVNQRPVHYKEILKLVRQYYSLQCKKDSSNVRYPVFFMNIVVHASATDVNLTPDKTQVLLLNKESVLSSLTTVLISLYGLLPDKLSDENTEIEDLAAVSPETSPLVSRNSDAHTTPKLSSNDTQNAQTEPVVQMFHNKNPDCPVNDTGNSDPNSAKDMTVQALDILSSYGNSQVIENVNEFGITVTLGDDSNQVDSDPVSNTESLLNRGLAKGRKVITQETDVGKSICECSADTWSMGTAIKNAEGGNLQPVHVLVPTEKRLKTLDNDDKNIQLCLDKLNSSKSPSKEMSNVVTEKLGQTTAYDLISSRTVRKPLSARDIFMQETRTKILAENPKSSIQDISMKIEDMWKGLKNEERNKYEERATKDLERYNMQTKRAMEVLGNDPCKGDKKQKPALQKHKLKAPLSNQQLLDKLFESQKEKKLRHASSLKSTKVQFSMSSLKTKLQQLSKNCSLATEGPHVIARLNFQGAWIIESEKKLMLLNPYRVEEALLFKRLMENHILPAESLEAPIVLTDSLLGGTQYMEALNNMQKECPQLSGVTYFSDPRLVANGFKIRLMPGASFTQNHLDIVEMASCLPYYGVSDLKEILHAILHKDAKMVHQCRSFKLVSYLQGEAVRLARQLPLRFSKEDIQDTICRMKQQLGKEIKMCVHGRPFFHYLVDIPEME